MEQAFQTFLYALDDGLLPDVVLYGILIHGYCKIGRLEDAVSLYHRMIEDGILPDSLIHGILAKYHRKKGQESLNARVSESEEIYIYIYI